MTRGMSHGVFSSVEKYYALAGVSYFTFFSIINVHENTQKAIKMKESGLYKNKAPSDIAVSDNLDSLMLNAATLIGWPVFFPLRIAYRVYNSHVDQEK